MLTLADEKILKNIMSPSSKSDQQKAPAPIAVVGLSCRLPGDISTPEEFWRFCCQAKSAWSKIPSTRFSADAYYHPNPDQQGSTHTQGGHFIENVSAFDAAFFDMTAEEAMATDPQQRLVLECGYEALENAGITKSSVSGERVGVFAAGSFSDYELSHFKDLQNTPLFQAPGCASSFLSNRLSHFFNFTGPSMTVDTACSSSLTALHLACQSLRTGESTHALVGGCHLNLTPDYFISYSLTRLFSDSGKCYPFDHRGDSGYGRGEGAACVVLKRLEDAVRDGDSVRAIIVNTGVNQDGHTPGIGVPSSDAQKSLMKSVYEAANVSPEETGYVEAHGTGTKIGDPLEARALYEVFGSTRSPQDPLFIGSVKSNFGHAEGASGLVSVVKTVLMLEKGVILPNCNFERGKDEIPLKDWNLQIPTRLCPWPEGRPYASINNFGFGGSNAHVVLRMAAAPRRPQPMMSFKARSIAPPKSISMAHIYVVSGNTEEAAVHQAKSIAAYLQQHPYILDRNLITNLAYTLCERRALLPWRIAVLAKSAKQLIDRLGAHDIKARRAVCARNIAFVFTGQGAHWHAMGRELLSSYPVFAKAIERADCHLCSLQAGFSLIDELSKPKDESQLSLPIISQSACTAVQIALTDLLLSWDITPKATIGHSSGEIAAAYAAKMLSPEDAMTLALARGTAAATVRNLPIRGSMMAVRASYAEATALIGQVTDDRVVVACVNSPRSVTISGDADRISDIQTLADSKSILCRRLNVDVAYHSHHMRSAAAQYRSMIMKISPSNSSIAFYSSSRSCRLKGTELQPSYWEENLLSPVSFSDALTTLLNDEAATGNAINCLVEIGPHPALEGPIRDILRAQDADTSTNYIPTLKKEQNAVETMHQLAETLVCLGKSLDLNAVNFPVPNDTQLRQLNDLPSYPWNHSKEYWYESRVSNNIKHPESPRHPLIGLRSAEGNDLHPQWRMVLRADDHPWLRQHQFHGHNVFPMAGYIAMAIEAALQEAKRSKSDVESFSLREISAGKALIVPNTTAVELIISLQPHAEGTRSMSSKWNKFHVSSWAEQKGWEENCHGLIAVNQKTQPNPVNGEELDRRHSESVAEKLYSIRGICRNRIQSKAVYDELSGYGVEYGRCFRGMQECHAHEGNAVVRATVPDTTADTLSSTVADIFMHPATLDICFQVAWLMLGAGTNELKMQYVASFIKQLTVSYNQRVSTGAGIMIYGEQIKEASKGHSTENDIWVVYDEDLPPMLHLNGLVMAPMGDHALSAPVAQEKQLCFKPTFIPLNDFAGEPSSGPCGKMVSLIYHDEPKWFPLNAVQEGFEKLTGNLVQVKALDEVSELNDFCIFIGEVEQSLLGDLTAKMFNSIQRMLMSASGLLWIVRNRYFNSQDPTANMAFGLARTLHLETGKPIAVLDTDVSQFAPEKQLVDEIIRVFQSAFTTSGKADLEFLSRDGVISVPRIVQDTVTNSVVYQDPRNSAPSLQSFHQEDRPLCLTIGEHGLLSSLYFTDNDKFTSPVESGHVELDVQFVGLNFKDAMYANNQIQLDGFGIECSGIVTAVGEDVEDFSAGDRLCAISEGSFASKVRCPAASAWKVPDKMSLDIAASIPVAFCTASYCLNHVARLIEDESILIHAAAGGVGQAAIILAQQIGANIYATVGSVGKKNFLMETYGIPESRIFFSRDLSFAESLRLATKGRGVDVVLNSIAGDAMRASVECLAPFGRFVEIGKTDAMTNSHLEMSAFDKNLSLSSVDLSVFARDRPRLMRRLFTEVFDMFREHGLDSRFSINRFNVSEVEAAFQLLQSGRSIGKTIVALQGDCMVKVSPATRMAGYLRSDATYMVIGAAGGLGQSITTWLASRGARNLILVTRSQTSLQAMQSLLTQLREKDLNVRALKCDISQFSEVSSFLSTEINGMPPLAGVIHSAMVVRDVLFDRMSLYDYNAVIKPKVHGLQNLSVLLQQTGSTLDFFIALSSIFGIVGNPGQAAYTAASTFMDSFAKAQRSRGIPFTTIDLCPVWDIGYLASNSETKERVRQTGINGITESEFHRILSAAIFTDGTGMLPNDHIMIGLAVPPTETARDQIEWLTDARFSHLVEASRLDDLKGTTNQISTVSPIRSPGNMLQQARSSGEAQDVVERALLHRVAEMVMCPMDEIDVSKPITACGVDSLSAIGFRKWIAREFDASLNMFDILSSSSMSELASICIAKSKMVTPECRDEPAQDRWITGRKLYQYDII